MGESETWRELKALRKRAAFSLRVIMAESCVGLSLWLSPKGHTLSYQQSIIDAWHRRGSFTDEQVRRGLLDTTLPGNIIDGNGSLLITANSAAHFGRFWVTDAQAGRAREFGWRVLASTHNGLGMVQIERTSVESIKWAEKRGII